jgi:hypothetical protein
VVGERAGEKGTAHARKEEEPQWGSETSPGFVKQGLSCDDMGGCLAELGTPIFRNVWKGRTADVRLVVEKGACVAASVVACSYSIGRKALL